MTQVELAAIAGISQSSLSRWESGKWSPRPQDVTAAAWKVLGLEPTRGEP